ncbi:coiled-coil domain-containing protein 170 isoform X3 [Ovis aries]|uniref:coiled-coil domain-containing protein 170 isoform X3 n=1 Tax=Ovis aries TaxID=9940 RepID=UPI001C2EB8F3|nr:coiled-coil domain-containing protein 170 isoform X3 [Ovis aries]
MGPLGRLAAPPPQDSFRRIRVCPAPPGRVSGARTPRSPAQVSGSRGRRQRPGPRRPAAVFTGCPRRRARAHRRLPRPPVRARRGTPAAMSSSGPRRPPPTGPAAFGASSPAPEEAYDHLVEVPVTREQLNHYRNVAEAARSELAATLVKFESAQSELRELRSKMLSKEASCQELKAEMESYKENNARKSSLLISLRDRVQELEEESAALSTSKIRTEITAQSAIKEKQELKKKVVELDEKLQKCLKENEENKNQVSQNCRKHEEFLAQLRDCLDPEKNEEASDEDLILKLGELCKENAFVKGQIVALEETINVHEMEAKASRETIMRLASEVNREQKKAASYIEEKGQLSQMVSQLEAQISKLVEQLGNESQFHQKALQRAQKAENKLETLQGQLTHLEEELVSGGVLRDDLNFEKQKYLKFLDQLSEKMKLDQMAAELGFDMRLDVVLARTEQLVRLESNAIIENKTIAHNLQRKLKTQKERLESKELHMNLLRQKIAHLEQEKQVRSAVMLERDEANATIRKLQKKVERLQKELSVCRELNTELKAKLADTNELKIKTLEQTKAIEDLNKSRDKLEKMKEKAEKKLLSVKSELETTEHEAKENKERARNMLEVVTSEMKTLKKSLEEAEKRERQLVDFREVVSQMLGLNMMSLALPDYEIIKCLERLIHAHQHHFVTCACLKDVTAKQDRPPQGHLQLPH